MLLYALCHRLGGGDFDVHNHYTLLIAFDSADRVVKYKKVASWGSSLVNVRGQALEWVEAQSLAVSTAPSISVGQVNSPGESALYIYRETEFWDYLTHGGYVPWEVSVNGRAVGWIRKGQYLAIMLAPGVHMVRVIIIPDIAYKAIGTGTTHFEALPGQAHYVSVRQSNYTIKDPPLVLTVRSEEEALPALKKMKPSP